MPVLYDIKENAQNMKRLYGLKDGNVKIDWYWCRLSKISDEFCYLFGKAKYISGAAYKDPETNRYDYKFDGKDSYLTIPLQKSDENSGIEKFLLQEFCNNDRYCNTFQCTLSLVDNDSLTGQMLNPDVPQAAKDGMLEVFFTGFKQILPSELDDSPDKIDPQLSPQKSRGSGRYSNNSETTAEALQAKKQFLIAEFPSLVTKESDEKDSDSWQTLESLAVAIQAFCLDNEGNPTKTNGEIMLDLLNFFS